LGEVVGVGEVVFIVRVGGGEGAIMTVIETERERDWYITDPAH
jgi:hypothetical protein